MKAEKEARATMEESREQFLKVAQEVYPLIDRIGKIMTENGMDSQASITISKDGYLEFRAYGTGWTMNRYKAGGNPKARYEYSEAVVVKGVA